MIDPETGLDAIRNVAIEGSLITGISEQTLAGTKTIDVKGKVVSPGFIDLHTRSPDQIRLGLQALDGVTIALQLELGSYSIRDYGAQIADQPRINIGISAGYM